jgi:TPR repeat protein
MSILSELVLYRPDPELVFELEARARQGDRDAIYGLGLVLAEGRGVDADPQRAWQWLTIATEMGDRDAGLLRQIVANQMSLEALASAEATLDGLRQQLLRPLPRSRPH